LILGGKMKNTDLIPLYVVAGVAAAATLAFGMWLIGADFLRTLALILVAGLMLALVLFASAFPVKAFRLPKTPPPLVEKHVIYNGTRTIERHTLDGRTVEAPRLFQLPAQPQAQAFPELLRAAYQSGLAGQRQAELPIDAEVRRLPGRDRDEDAFSSWGGDILE
jgi:hypothetical protein